MVLKPIIIKGVIYGIEGAKRIVENLHKKKEAKGNPKKKDGR
jgi:hypothetical protein